MKGVALIVFLVSVYSLFIAFYRRDLYIEVLNEKLQKRLGMGAFIAVELLFLSGSLYILFR
jgi:hypothetical protein